MSSFILIAWMKKTRALIQSFWQILTFVHGSSYLLYFATHDHLLQHSIHILTIYKVNNVTPSLNVP